jgi:hypothetical protein
MPTSKPIPDKGVPILLPKPLVERIDAIKPELVPRATFVKDLLDKALRAQEEAQR